MGYQTRLRKNVEKGKIRVYFPDQICKSKLFNRDLTVVGRGFCQYINDKKIGYGINMCYEISHSSVYCEPEDLPREVLYTQAVEKAIGFDTMHNYYTNSNLSALVTALGQYVDYEEALMFIKNIDFLYRMKLKHPMLRNDFSINECRQMCEGFLITLASNKIAELRACEKIGLAEAMVHSIEYGELIDSDRLTIISNEIDNRVNKILKEKRYSKNN